MRIAAMLVVLLLAGQARADLFDLYTNEILTRVPESKKAKKVPRLTQTMLVQHARALPGASATFAVVRTNEGRLSKVLLIAGRQKVDAEKQVPILLIDRFVTYKEGEERTVQAHGQNVRLFPDFRFNLDWGQVVPKEVPADLRFVAEGDDVHVEPVGKAELYLVTAHLTEANPKPGARPTPGTAYNPKFLEGSFKLHEDGRRSGTLQLRVTDEGDILGHYYSDKDGQKYEVTGKVGMPDHAVQFRITYPRSVQQFQGWIFTGDGAAITGSARLQERETGFYAIRIEK